MTELGGGLLRLAAAADQMKSEFERLDPEGHGPAISPGGVAPTVGPWGAGPILDPTGERER